MITLNIEHCDFHLDGESRYVVKTVLGKKVEQKGGGWMKECQHTYFYADTIAEVFEKIGERMKKDLVLIDEGSNG